MIYPVDDIRFAYLDPEELWNLVTKDTYHEIEILQAGDEQFVTQPYGRQVLSAIQDQKRLSVRGRLRHISKNDMKAGIRLELSRLYEELERHRLDVLKASEDLLFQGQHLFGEDLQPTEKHVTTSHATYEPEACPVCHWMPKFPALDSKFPHIVVSENTCRHFDYLASDLMPEHRRLAIAMIRQCLQ